MLFSRFFPRRSRSRHLSLVALPLAALAVLAVGACANLLAIDGPVVIKGADASTSACGIPAGTASCQACLESQCCPQATACAQSSACKTYESCIVPCGSDYGCRASCAVDRAKSLEISALDQCVAARCEAACGVKCAVTAAVGEPDAAVSCLQCIVANDCVTAEACGTNLECVQILGCVGSCPTPDCQEACAIGKDAGAALLQPLVTALSSTCVAACQYGGSWDCIGKVTDPLAPANVINLTVNVRNLAASAQMPLPGIHVLACGPADTACANPVASGDTDAQGNAVLVLPSASGGFVGHFELTSPVDAGADSYAPLLYYLAYRLSAPASSLQMSMLTESLFASEIALGGTTVDPERGSVVVAAYDCALDLAPNVALQASGTDSESRFLYLSGTLFSGALTETASTGFAVLVNAKPGTIDLTATPTAVGVVSSRASVQVRKGAISYVALLPN
jgi:hypothetical protein